jgi:hypothetical protein
MAFGIATQQTAGGFKPSVMAEASENIQHLALARLRV